MSQVRCLSTLKRAIPLDAQSLTTSCPRITPITLWNTIGASRREALLSEYMPLRKLWNKAKTNYDAAEDKAALDFDSTWLSVFIQNFIELLYTLPAKGQRTFPSWACFLFFLLLPLPPPVNSRNSTHSLFFASR